MHHTSLLSALLATATLAMANTVTFRSLDSTSRTIIFTPNNGCGELPDLTVAGNTEEVADFPDGWAGNWYSISEGSENAGPGMLGEVMFGGYGGGTFFDVSAIVNPSDNDGVKEMWPLGQDGPVSGCKVFPCDTVYKKPDDVQTLSTEGSDLVCTLGS